MPGPGGEIAHHIVSIGEIREQRSLRHEQAEHLSEDLLVLLLINEIAEGVGHDMWRNIALGKCEAHPASRAFKNIARRGLPCGKCEIVLLLEV
jgi:hypothetical protein